MLQLRVFDPRTNIAAIADGVATFVRYKDLVLEITRREIVDRYAAQALGSLWVIGSPLLLLATYVLAFTFIFRIRLGADDNGSGYICYVLAGLVPWLALADALSRATNAVVGSASLVKQIVFPTEILPLTVALASLPGLFIGLVVAVVASIFSGRATLLGIGVLLPCAAILYIVTVAGVAYVLAAVSVFVRDTREVVAFLLAIGFLLHPILYPPQGTPRWVEWMFAFSPFSYLIRCFQDALVNGEVTRGWSWAISAIFAPVMFAIGWRIFRLLRPAFGNVL